jgi:transcriptional regulator with XRE-family HTH domain
VRHYREAAGLSPKELARHIGPDWTASTVRRIERGARKATAGQMAELATALGQPAATLFPDSPGPAPVADNKGKVIGKRTGEALTSKADVQAEVGAILGG